MLSKKVRSTEQLLTEMARLQAPPQELDIRNGSVHAIAPVPRGTRFGPFLGKLINEPIDQRFAWEVSQKHFISVFKNQKKKK